ncbi:MAG: hypothetical protein AB1459_16565 [Pseudomonadota bacterium]
MAEMQRSPNDCVKCGGSLSGGQSKREIGSAPAATKKRKGTMSVAMVVALLMVAIAVGFVGLKLFQKHQAVSAIEAELRLTTAQTRRVVTALDGAQGMTFAEYFQKANSGISEIDAAMVRVSVVRPVVELAASAEAYMKASQELIRSMSSVMRVSLDYSNAQDRLKSAKEDGESSNSYTRERALNRQIAATDELIKLLKTMEDAKNSTRKAAVDLLAAGEAVGGADGETVIARSVLERFTKESK